MESRNKANQNKTKQDQYFRIYVYNCNTTQCSDFENKICLCGEKNMIKAEQKRKYDKVEKYD